MMTINGFTPEFEKMILKKEKDSKNKVYSWNGRGSFTKYLDKLK